MDYVQPDLIWNDDTDHLTVPALLNICEEIQQIVRPLLQQQVDSPYEVEIFQNVCHALRMSL